MWALEHLTNALIETRQYDEALQVLDRRLTTQPDNVDAPVLRVRTLRNVLKYQEALDEIQRAVKLAGDNAAVHGEMGETLRLMQRYDEALEATNRAVELAPDSAWSLGTKGQILKALGRYEEAATVLRAAVERATGLSWVHFELGEVLRLLNRPAEALTALEKALELDPSSAIALGTKGQVLAMLNRLDEAAEALRAAHRLDSSLTWVLLSLADALRSNGDHLEAVDVADQVLTGNPDDVAALGTKGAALNSLGRYDDARDALDRAIRIDPEYAWAIAIRAQVSCDTAQYHCRPSQIATGRCKSSRQTGSTISKGGRSSALDRNIWPTRARRTRRPSAGMSPVHGGERVSQTSCMPQVMEAQQRRTTGARCGTRCATVPSSIR